MKKNLLITLLTLATLTLTACSKEEAPVVEEPTPVVEEIVEVAEEETVVEVELEKVEDEIVLSEELQAELDKIAGELKLTDEEYESVAKLLAKNGDRLLVLGHYKVGDECINTEETAKVVTAVKVAGAIDPEELASYFYADVREISMFYDLMDKYGYTHEDIIELGNEYGNGYDMSEVVVPEYSIEEIRKDRTKCWEAKAYVDHMADYMADWCASNRAAFSANVSDLKDSNSKIDNLLASGSYEEAKAQLAVSKELIDEAELRRGTEFGDFCGEFGSFYTW